MADLIDTGQIADILGVTREHVTDKLTKRPDFPAPAVNVSRKLRRWDRSESNRLAWRVCKRELSGLLLLFLAGCGGQPEQMHDKTIEPVVCSASGVCT